MIARVVLDPRHPRGVADALSRINSVVWELPPSADDMFEAIAGCDILVSFHWDDRYLVDSLRWIQSISAGVEQFPTARLARAGVAVTSARGVHGPQVAEHAFALLLALTRRVGIAVRDSAEGAWTPRMGYELAGGTMGVLGLGTIGEEIARRATAWGMTVIGTKRNPGDYAGVASGVWGPERTTDVMSQSDAVVSVLPDTPETRGSISVAEFEALGAGWFVNVGRGSVVDESALLAALDGRLRGAGLDVTRVEPLAAGSSLWSHPKVVLTPHMAGLSPEYGPRLARIFEANLSAYRGSGAWLNRVV